MNIFDTFFSLKGKLTIVKYCIARLILMLAMPLVQISYLRTPKDYIYYDKLSLVALFLILTLIYSVFAVDVKRLADLKRSKRFALIGVFTMASLPIAILNMLINDLGYI